MANPSFLPHRRRFVQGMAVSAAALWAPGALAEELMRTPRQTEGPFYPNKLPLDTDNDLLVINDALTPAVGQITHLTGRVLSPVGEPVRNAAVEIWQVDSTGTYIHTDDVDRRERDKNFQGFGRFVTGSTGQYYFRTIKPVPYGPRTPHIHFAIDIGGRRMLTTQMYIKGEKQNERDFIYRSLRDPKDRAALTIDFVPVKDSRIGELAANFDIVLGKTPEDAPRRR